MTKIFWSAIRWVQSDNRQSTIENLKSVVGIIIFAFTLAFSVMAGAQPTKIPRIGYFSYLSGSAGPLSARTEAFRQGLRDLGYVEGKNIVIEWRSWEGKLDRQRAFAAELVRLKVEVIVAVG